MKLHEIKTGNEYQLGRANPQRVVVTGFQRAANTTRVKYRHHDQKVIRTTVSNQIIQPWADHVAEVEAERTLRHEAQEDRNRRRRENTELRGNVVRVAQRVDPSVRLHDVQVSPGPAAEVSTKVLRALLTQIFGD